MIFVYRARIPVTASLCVTEKNRRYRLVLKYVVKSNVAPFRVKGLGKEMGS